MLAVSNLSVSVHKAQILNNVSFTLEKGEMLTLTGASGSGKTTLIRALSGVLRKPYHVSCSYMSADGSDLVKLSNSARREQCGFTFGYIPQNPMIAFDPRLPIGKQMVETLKIKKEISLQKAMELAADTLKMVSLADSSRVLRAYPSELSGGMLQRITIAICIGLQTKYIFADEPTASLDEKSRGDILELMKERLQSSGILLITHDIELISMFGENMLLMDDGCIVERGDLSHISGTTQNSWTKAFLAAVKEEKEVAEAWTAL